MKIRFAIFSVLFSITAFVRAQDLNRNDLIHQLNADKESSFIINGESYSLADSLKLNQQLKGIDRSKVCEIGVIKKDDRLPHLQQDVIIITHAVLLSRKSIKNKLKEIKPKFSNPVNSEDPVLFVDGNRIPVDQSKKTIDSQKPNDMGYICFTEIEQSSEYHSVDSKNGIVFIWTKNKLAEDLTN